MDNDSKTQGLCIESEVSTGWLEVPHSGFKLSEIMGPNEISRSWIEQTHFFGSNNIFEFKKIEVQIRFCIQNKKKMKNLELKNLFLAK